MNTEQWGELQRTLGRMEGKLNEVCRATLEHEKRLRSLENWRWYVVGLFSLGVLASVVGFVFL